MPAPRSRACAGREQRGCGDGSEEHREEENGFGGGVSPSRDKGQVEMSVFQQLKSLENKVAEGW